MPVEDINPKLLRVYAPIRRVVPIHPIVFTRVFTFILILVYCIPFYKVVYGELTPELHT